MRYILKVLFQSCGLGTTSITNYNTLIPLEKQLLSFLRLHMLTKVLMTEIYNMLKASNIYYWKLRQTAHKNRLFAKPVRYNSESYTIKNIIRKVPLEISYFGKPKNNTTFLKIEKYV